MNLRNSTNARNEERERERRRWRDNARARRQSMSAEQREQHLARRRANYRRQRQPINEFGSHTESYPTNIDRATNVDPVIHQQPTIAGTTLSVAPDDGTTTGIRLTNLRRVARNLRCDNSYASNISNQVGRDNTSTRNYLVQMRNDFEAGPSHSNSINPNVPNNSGYENINGVHDFIEQGVQGNYLVGMTNDFEAGPSNSNSINPNVPNNSAYENINVVHDSTEQGVQGNYMRSSHNCATNFHETRGAIRSHLTPPRACHYCNARLFFHESSDMCCKNGKISLTQIPVPPAMLEIFADQSAEGKHFKRYIRTYNHVFAFTSMGVHVDESIAATSRGIYTFRAQGAIYHRIGSLLPDAASRPRFLQLYIYDTEHEIDNRLSECEILHRNIVEKIQRILDTHNPFVHMFRQLAQRPDISQCKIIIKEQPSTHRQYSLPTSSQVAAIIVGGDEAGQLNGRDIMVETVSGQLMNVRDVVGYYDPLQYPLLLPCGTYGWDVNSRSINGGKVTCREFYSYMFQIRPNIPSLLHLGGRLLQQYAVDNIVKIESHKLNWVRNNQNVIRAELYQGLQDSLQGGENNAGNIGRRTVLPSSFVGSPRDMLQRFQDAMSIVQKFGKPDLFLTMTCNPQWPEIINELLPGQVPQDRPDLLTRIFRSKFEEFKDDVINKGVLGKVIAYVYVFEYQKRGLPHVHMLLILDDNDKLHAPEDYDRVVRAEIPNKEEEPELYTAVLKHMIHGPCGVRNRNSPCMKNGICKRGYPKSFSTETYQGNDSYAIYRRRDTLPVPLINHSNTMVDNSWVVPYNPWLLLKYDCHVNIEICCSIKSVKYLYKYVYKGPDRVSIEVRPAPNYDEVQHFVDARWICAPEAFWRICKFPLYRVYPSVERLQIHLPNRQHVRFYSHDSITSVLADSRNSKTMLTEFFSTNCIDAEARNYLYREFPEHYCWNNTRKEWSRRRSHKKVIGRIYTVTPSEGERFYLRVLLNHVRGSKGFEDLLTVNGLPCATFKEAAEMRGLLENDNSIRLCMLEAANIRMPPALRRLFATILVFCEPIGVRDLWTEFFPYMIEDYPSSSSTRNVIQVNRLLNDLNAILLQHGKRVTNYDLPTLTEVYDHSSSLPRIIQDELSIPISNEDLIATDRLNDDQKIAYNTIMGAIERNECMVFFVDGPGGTGKTFLYRTILASLRNQGHIVIATATSGIAATLLPGGRTAHSRFKIPINPDASSTCSISKQSDLAELIRRAIAVIWDEAPMANRRAFEALDRTLRDIMEVNLPFGGKVFILGGDFRQVLPVVPKGTKAEMIDACIINSPLWKDVKVLHLRQNMRSRNDHQFSEYLMRIGDGNEAILREDMIKLSSPMAIQWEGDHSIDQLIEHVFPNLENHTNDARFMVDRALLTPINDDIDKLNDKIINQFPGQEEILHSYDEVEGDANQLYQQEFLNSISPGGLPPHVLRLKKGAPIMLLRNIDPKVGLCNGTRLLCRGCMNNVVDAEILSGEFVGTRVFLPRITLKTTENVHLPFVLTRRQFPIRLSFALTINKSQGQTIPNVGIYLPEHVFSHGQLYVALSRGISQSTTKILVKNGAILGESGIYTRNVVYKEVLTSSSS